MIKRSSLLILVLVFQVACQKGNSANTLSNSMGLEESSHAISEMRRLGFTDSVCEIHERGIRYIGVTDDKLVECIALWNTAEPLRLEITSPGGPVPTAIEVANLLSDMSADIAVVGLCGSSCANYLLPIASSLTVKPYSAVVLHGAPILDPVEVRLVVIEALRAANLTEDVMTDRFIDDQVEKAIREANRSENFRTNNGIGWHWFYADLFYTDSADYNMLPSKELIRRCVDDINIVSYWYPPNEAAVEELERILEIELFLPSDEYTRNLDCNSR